MPSPDARPVGEAEAETGERTEHMSMKAATARRRCTEWLPERDHEAYPHAIAALDTYRDAVAAEARAALLAGAPVVWVATDRGARISHLSPGRWEMYDGIAFAYEDSESMPLWSHPPLTPPGTCVRYRLVPDPEETP